MFPIKKVIIFIILILGFSSIFFIVRDTVNLSFENEADNIQPQVISNEEISEEKINQDTYPKETTIKKTKVNEEKITNNQNINPFAIRKTPKPLTLMLFGVDRTNDEKYGRSDSIMLAFVQPNTKELMLISIPRDTYIEIPNYGNNKLNTAFQLGGPELTKETVENWLNIEINDTVSIDYANFEDMIDLIGGIEIDVDRRMVHNEFTLEKGVQTLSGEEALHFVRFRKSIDGNHDSDYKRTERQRQVLSKLTDELLKTRSFRESFTLLRSLINTIDTTISIQKIIIYGHHYSDFTSENITALSFEGYGDLRDGLWYEIIPNSELEEKKQLIYEFMNRSEIQIR